MNRRRRGTTLGVNRRQIPQNDGLHVGSRDKRGPRWNASCGDDRASPSYPEVSRPTGRTEVFALEVRISGKWGSNHAAFQPLEIPLISIACEIRTKSAKSTASERIGPRRAIFGLFRAEPVNRSAPETPGILPSSGGIGRAERAGHFESGGEGGIRTHGTVARTSVFETDPFDRSVTSPAY